MQDVNLVLRDTLKAFMNEYSNELKSRWLVHRKAYDADNSIQTDDKELDIVNTKKILKL